MRRRCVFGGRDKWTENGGKDRRVWFCMYVENLGYMYLSAKTGMCVSVWSDRCVNVEEEMGMVWR